MKNITRVWIGDPFEGGHFNGTAFFIDGHTLVTAKHVVVNKDEEEYENVFLSNTPDGGVTPVVSIELCERDIAILKVKKAFEINKINMLFTDELSVGDSVNIVGFYDKNSSQKSYEHRVSGYQNHDHTYELQNHLTHGLSGSPVLLDGKIAGITKAINSSKNLTYVIPIKEVCYELEMDQKDEEPEKKSFYEFILPAIMPSIIILMILYLFMLMLDLQEFFITQIYGYIFLSFLLTKSYLFIKEKK